MVKCIRSSSFVCIFYFLSGRCSSKGLEQEETTLIQELDLLELTQQQLEICHNSFKYLRAAREGCSKKTAANSEKHVCRRLVDPSRCGGCRGGSC